MALAHLPLVSTVAASLTVAFACGLVTSKLRMSPIVGYLIAGIIIGPHTPGYMADMKVAEELSEIGVVLLMFGVGLHFSLEDFLEVRRIALTGAILRILIVTGMGVGLGWWWGWPLESSVMLGLSLSVASTVVLLRAFEERNAVQSIEGRIAIGWLIVEDLVMILGLVLIPTLATLGGKSGAVEPIVILKQLALAIGKVSIFAAIMMVGGKRFLPWLLSVVSRTGSRELFTLAVFAMAMGVAFGAAALFDVSFALGAFFAGMMIKDSELNHEVVDRAVPFQDAFAVLFFVAVGMLFNPFVLVEKPLSVLAVASIIIVGKMVVTFTIIHLFGYPLKTALKVGAGLAQIGEFSFILVTLGISLKLLPVEGRDLILAGAIFSIALNPILLYFSRALYQHIGSAPRLRVMFNLRDDDLSHLRADEKRALKELVILIGAGRVGEQIIANIHAQNIDLVIIDRNREKVEQLRAKGFHAIFGDGTQKEVLHEAAIEKALAVLVTAPDPFEARAIVEEARRIKPALRVIVKAQNDEEVEYFNQKNVKLVVAQHKEVSRRMLEHLGGLTTSQPPSQHH